jgi:spore photoproduct lyase
MFEPQVFGGKKKIGKYSFTEEERVEIFSFALSEVRRYAPDVTVALCKESAAVWDRVGLEVSRCSCVCQVGEVDMQPGSKP